MDFDWSTWHDAAARPEIDRAISDLYACLDDQIAARGPTCWSSGKCCRFDAFGHRLYVTGLEITRFLGNVRSAMSDVRSDIEDGSIALPIVHRTSNVEHLSACPYQVDGLCSVHAERPMGCRVFFCQQGTEDWQRDLYELYLRELKAVHERFDLPYAYMEWRAGLSEAVRAIPAACE